MHGGGGWAKMTGQEDGIKAIRFVKAVRPSKKTLAAKIFHVVRGIATQW